MGDVAKKRINTGQTFKDIKEEKTHLETNKKETIGCKDNLGAEEVKPNYIVHQSKLWIFL